MTQLTIHYGMQSASRSYTTRPTVEQLKRDSSLRAELGFGDNVRVLVDGAEQPGYVELDGGHVTIETAANKKA